MKFKTYQGAKPVYNVLNVVCSVCHKTLKASYYPIVGYFGLG